MHNVHTKKHQQAPDIGKHCARGGTRTGLQAAETLGSRRNKRNPGQSGTGTAQSEAQGVHIVHTLIFAQSVADPEVPVTVQAKSVCAARSVAPIWA